MTLEVTSWFIGETLKKVSQPIRKFYIDTGSDTADLTDYVTKWPTIRHHWNMLRPNNIVIKLANTEGDLNFLHLDKLMMRKNAEIKLGYTHPESGDELINIFKGEVNRIALKHGSVDAYFTDKWEDLTHYLIGNKETPIDFTTSEHLASDLVWYICTSFGNLDATQDSSNPDIDWLAWDEFNDRVVADNVLFQGYFDGVKASEALKRMAMQLDTAIFVDETNRLTFKRFTVAETNVTSLTGENVISCNIEVDENDMINRQYVYADYDVSSNLFNTLVEDTSTPSINSFGLNEEYHEDDVLWHVNSSSAIGLAQRVLLLYKEPFQKIDIKTTLAPITRTIGETLYINNPLFEVEGGYRLLEKKVNLETGEMSVAGNATTFLAVFTLDYSSLDSIYVLL